MKPRSQRASIRGRTERPGVGQTAQIVFGNRPSQFLTDQGRRPHRLSRGQRLRDSPHRPHRFVAPWSSTHPLPTDQHHVPLSFARAEVSQSSCIPPLLEERSCPILPAQNTQGLRCPGPRTLYPARAPIRSIDAVSVTARNLARPGNERRPSGSMGL